VITMGSSSDVFLDVGGLSEFMRDLAITHEDALISSSRINMLLSVPKGKEVSLGDIRDVVGVGNVKLALSIIAILVRFNYFKPRGGLMVRTGKSPRHHGAPRYLKQFAAVTSAIYRLLLDEDVGVEYMGELLPLYLSYIFSEPMRRITRYALRKLLSRNMNPASPRNTPAKQDNVLILGARIPLDEVLTVLRGSGVTVVEYDSVLIDLISDYYRKMAPWVLDRIRFLSSTKDLDEWLRSKENLVLLSPNQLHNMGLSNALHQLSILERWLGSCVIYENTSESGVAHLNLIDILMGADSSLNNEVIMSILRGLGFRVIDISDEVGFMALSTRGGGYATH